MTRTELTTHELQKAGFQVKVDAWDILVSLKNRKVSKMEVETALEQVFDGVQFNISHNPNGVTVRV